MNKVKRIARKARKELRNSLDAAGIAEYLENCGYYVMLFNTPAGDKEIERYGLEKKKDTLKAFTYTATARIVFADAKLHPDDRMYLLLHELGHILLGHTGDGKLTWRNHILIDIEADAFVYEVIKQ